MGDFFCKSWVGLEFLWCPVNFILGAIIIDQGIERICVETWLWWICLKGCYHQSNLKSFRIFYVLHTVGKLWNLITALINSWEFLKVGPIQELNMLTDSSSVFSLQVWLPGEVVDGLGTSFVETLAQWTASATISVRETWRIVGTDGRDSRVKFEIWNPKEMPSSAEIGHMLECWSETSWPHPLAQHGSLASPADARAVPWKLFGGRGLEFLPQTFPHVFFDQTVGTESGQCFSRMRSGEFPFMSGDLGVENTLVRYVDFRLLDSHHDFTFRGRLLLKDAFEVWRELIPLLVGPIILEFHQCRHCLKPILKHLFAIVVNGRPSWLNSWCQK